MRFFYTEEEFSAVRDAADADNTSIASYVARVALTAARQSSASGGTSVGEALGELIVSRAQLRRIGNNLNQIAHVLNSGGTVAGAQLDAVLRRVDEAVHRVDDATLQVMRERRRRP